MARDPLAHPEEPCVRICNRDCVRVCSDDVHNVHRPQYDWVSLLWPYTRSRRSWPTLPFFASINWLDQARDCPSFIVLVIGPTKIQYWLLAKQLGSQCQRDGCRLGSNKDMDFRLPRLKDRWVSLPLHSFTEEIRCCIGLELCDSKANTLIGVI